MNYEATTSIIYVYLYFKTKLASHIPYKYYSATQTVKFNRQHPILRKTSLNKLSFNALRNIYNSLAFICKGGEMVSTPFTVCKYTKFSNTAKQNARKITNMWRKQQTPRKRI